MARTPSSSQAILNLGHGTPEGNKIGEVMVCLMVLLILVFLFNTLAAIFFSKSSNS